MAETYEKSHGASIDPPVPSLRAAVRKARLEEAERSDVVAELRGAEIARLEMLQEAIAPILAQVPEGVELFDAGLALGERPKLFVDMLAFVEMARDRRVYSFVQASRHGRLTLAESERIEPISAAVTDYVARRLVEREKALASGSNAELAGASADHEGLAPHVKKRGLFVTALAFITQILGIITLLALLAAGAAFVADEAPRWLAAHPFPIKL